MAVAAFEGSLVLYALRSMDEMRQDVEGTGDIRSENFMPVREVSAMCRLLEYLQD